MSARRHFAAIAAGLATYTFGSALNIAMLALNGGWMPHGAQPSRLYWLADRFQIIGAHPGYVLWASVGDFLVWGGEAAIAATWVVWALELAIRRRRSRVIELDDPTSVLGQLVGDGVIEAGEPR